MGQHSEPCAGSSSLDRRVDCEIAVDHSCGARIRRDGAILPNLERPRAKSMVSDPENGAVVNVGNAGEEVPCSLERRDRVRLDIVVEYHRSIKYGGSTNPNTSTQSECALDVDIATTAGERQ